MFARPRWTRLRLRTQVISMSRATTDGRRMCSLASRASGEDPIGTASAFQVCVAMELPTPWVGLWSEAATASKELLDAFAPAWERGATVRPLALAPDSVYSVPGKRRVLFFKRPAMPFDTFDRSEYIVPETALAPLVDAYLNSPANLQGFRSYEQANSGMRDLLVCTHGNVDACCARFGFPAYREIREECATGASGRVRAWRCSHFGGHRFAPTMITFPDGRYWARLNEGASRSVMSRAGDIEGLVPHYRGWAGLDTPFEQVVEREVWRVEGWRWHDYRVSGRVLDIGGGLGVPDEELKVEDGPEWAEVRLEFERPDGSRGAYEARVEVCGRVTTVGCGRAAEPVLQYRLTRFARFAGAWNARDLRGPEVPSHTPLAPAANATSY